MDYGATTTKVSFEVQKALLTVTAKNVTVKVDEETASDLRFGI